MIPLIPGTYSTSQRQKGEWQLPETRGKRGGELSFNGYRASVLKDEGEDGWW